ncbi:MAG: LysR family transcriptional regulator [Piscinibacter sp.]|jgi:DNA-binding transcriptional LysR family regulator|uniref:LysR family transcriptional regulator n=1 Tax=Piscinibacter sp. TaxID=1903157 RepID=UPI002586D5D9|nr:LysR family transcriptional regulator [Piscinibacter sp.]MCW5663874.1 LysR family transcriptional regulator [Piscinibacter sp.]
MEMELKLVEAFTLIMRAGSLTKAETQTGMSKATLSRLLRKLEEDLGVQLLSRSSRKVTPTDAGRAFHAHCEALLADVSGRWETARHEVQEMATGGKGRLRVLADNHFTTTFVCHVARLFLEKYPNIRCELDAAGREDSPRMEDVDCYVCAEAPDLPDVVAKLVGRLTYGLYASPSYLRANGTPTSPKELTSHISITLRKPEFAATAVLHSEKTSHPYVSRSTVGTNDYWVMKTFCVDGLGIALLPDFFAGPEVKHGSLVPVLPDWKPERRRIFCAYQRQRYAAKKLQAFISLLTESMADIDSFNTYVASSVR